MIGRAVSSLASLSRISLPAVVLCLVAVDAASAQEYEFDSALEVRTVGIYRKDSVVVADPDERGEWTVSGATQFDATHVVSAGAARILVDHAVVAATPFDTSPQESSVGATGTAGTGGADLTTVELSHEVYRAYVDFETRADVDVRLGRQRIDWGVGWTLSATDALHPHSSDDDESPGFDGAAARLAIRPDISLDLAVALQNAVDTGDIADIRYAARGAARTAAADAFISVVYQNRTMLRPGAGVGVPIGPLRLAGEVAVEAYDPRGERVDTQLVGNAGIEYIWSRNGADASVVAEYLYNGLEEHYPGVTSSSLLVTSDFAGGFARPGRHYAAATIHASLADSWSTEHGALFNLVDESAVFEHRVTFLSIPIVDLSAAVTWNRGVVESEFGLIGDGMVVELAARATL